jgi:GWxTD domain-containing protein
MFRNTKTLLTLLVIVFAAGSFLYPQEKVKRKDLAAHHQNFLDLTQYIMTDQEKDVFMILTSDLDRDIFIESFWKHRDPTPGTPENEYKEEIVQRYEYANKYLARETVREGWKTDRGMFYIILGPPDSKESFVEQKGVYPTEVWYYYGDTSKGLPTYFALVFYQRGGFGEFKLYDPVADGISSLLIEGRMMDPFDYEKLYRKILEIAPTLAGVTLSLIPGETPLYYNPSTRSAILIQEIMDSPKKDINTAYATHFLDYKGMVSTDYMTNYIESDSHMALLKDPVSGLNFLHFSLAPKDLSVDYYEPNDQYFCNFILDVSLRRGEKVVLQYSKTIPYYFPTADVEKVSANGIAVEDSFPVAEGFFDLSILLRNTVGKEFTVIERKLDIPEQTNAPHILGPLAGYQLNLYDQDVYLPYKLLDQKLVIDPKDTFAAQEDIYFLFVLSNLDQNAWENGRIVLKIEGIREQDPVEQSYIIRPSSYPFRNIISMTHTVPGGELPPDYYEVDLSLIVEGSTVAVQNSQFIVSPLEGIGHPIINAKGVPSSNAYIYYYMLANQYNVIEEMERAEAIYQRAFQMNPGYQKGVIEYVHFLLKAAKYKQGLELIERIKEDARLKFDYFLLKGKLFMGSGDYAQAIENFEQGNRIYNSNISLLNDLGLCYYRIDDREKALEVFKASLKLNTDQPEIQELVKKLESRDQ